MDVPQYRGPFYPVERGIVVDEDIKPLGTNRFASIRYTPLDMVEPECILCWKSTLPLSVV